MQERLAGCLNIASEWSKPIFNNAKGKNAKNEIQRGNLAKIGTCIHFQVRFWSSANILVRF